MESLWLSGEAPERGTRKVWGSIPRGGSEFLLCPTLMARWKNNSLYYLTERKTYHPSCSISRHFIVLMHSVIRMNAFDYLARWLTYYDRLCSRGPRSIPSLQSNTESTVGCELNAIYESHIKKRTPSVILVSASQFSTLSKLIGMCKLNFAVCKIWISNSNFDQIESLYGLFTFKLVLIKN